ncbi:HAMP domain-containing protein [Paenibacillaceae bacterium]|nr:HAMP domain-containing protein [Paenibacillaceae bacterium]
MGERPNRYIPLRYKLLFSYIMLVMIPVLVIGTYSYLFSQRTTEERTRENLEVALKQFNNNVRFRVADIIRSSDAIYDDQVLSRNLAGYHLNMERYQVMTQNVLPKLESASLLPNVKVLLSIYLDDPSISEFYYEEKEEFLRDGHRQYGILYTDRIRDTDWYQALDLNYGSMEWIQVGTDEQYQNISLIRSLVDYEMLKVIGLIKVTFKLRDIFEDIDFSGLGDGTKLLIVDGNKKLLYADSKTMKEYDESLLTDTVNYLQMSETIDNMSAEIIALVPVTSFKQDSLQMRNITILVCMLSLALALVLSVLTTKVFTKRFSKLVISLQAFKEGELHRRIKYRGNDEFRQISEAFNEMAATIQNQINEIYISKLDKKEAELQILHAQINPHFLYNTFSSISRMAKLGELEKLHEIIRALAKFYRLTLNKGEMVIPLGKEIEIVEAYLAIQNIKYAGRIIVDYELDRTLLVYETAKFVLQPFVENILEHAWYDDQIEIKIALSKQDGRIRMEVRDNGLGMKEETIAAIFSESGNGIGYGIRNVDQRLKLHFGQEYGVSISSVVGEGTTIYLDIPIRSAAVVHKAKAD